MDWILLGSRSELRPVSEARFARQWQDPTVRADLVDIGLDRPEQVAALFLADAQGLGRFVGDTPPLVDNWPHRLDPSAPIDWQPYRAFVEAVGVDDFTSSSLARLWPAELRARSVPWFRWQRVLDRHFWGERDADPDRLFGDLHELLAGTRLRMLSVLMLGSDPDRQYAAGRLAGRGETGPWISAELAVAAMSRRDYPEAVARADEALSADDSLEWMRFVRLYALVALGEDEPAREGLDAWGERAPPAARRLLSTLLSGERAVRDD